MTAKEFLQLIRADRYIDLDRKTQEIDWDDLDFEISTHEEAVYTLEALGLEDIVLDYPIEEIKYIIENEITVATIYLSDGVRFYQIIDE